MTRIFATALAATLLAAGLPTQAAEHRFMVDLSGLDLATPVGADTAAARMARAVDDYCGPIEMPQPAPLQRAREACRAAPGRSTPARPAPLQRAREACRATMQARAQETIARLRRGDGSAPPIEHARAVPDTAHMLP